MRLRPAILVGATAVLALAAGAPTLFLYNGSPSAPVGFYVRTTSQPVVGSYVTVRAVEVAPAYAALRRFDDADDRFIKRVAAAAGVQVCAQGEHVRLGHRTLLRRSHDNAGRALPAWSGCRTLAADELFLVGETQDSFDSRYWGPVRRRDVDGVWRPMTLALSGA